MGRVAHLMDQVRVNGVDLELAIQRLINILNFFLLCVIKQGETTETGIMYVALTEFKQWASAHFEE